MLDENLVNAPYKNLMTFSNVQPYLVDYILKTNFNSIKTHLDRLMIIEDF